MDAEKVTKVCPECGIDLSGIDHIAHALEHWPEYLDPAKSSTEARSRQKLAMSGGVTPAVYAKLHGGE